MSSTRRLALPLAVLALAYGLLMLPAHGQSLHQAQLSWPAFEQYQADGQLLLFPAPSQARGQLLIWPELNQTHLWLPVAHHWQQRHWEVRVLLPDSAQYLFDPSSEQPSTEQQAWLTEQLARLTALTLSAPQTQPASDKSTQNHVKDSTAEKSTEYPSIMLVQGSAALWYQQWVDSAQLPTPQALILFDALPPSPDQQAMLAISLARSPYPILDIYRHPNSPRAWHNQQRRQQQLSRREKTGYALQHFISVEHLNKQIAGWLVRLGWLPLPANAPHYLKEQQYESGISRSRNPATTGPAATP